MFKCCVLILCIILLIIAAILLIKLLSYSDNCKKTLGGYKNELCKLLTTVKKSTVTPINSTNNKIQIIDLIDGFNTKAHEFKTHGALTVRFNNNASYIFDVKVSNTEYNTYLVDEYYNLYVIANTNINDINSDIKSHPYNKLNIKTMSSLIDFYIFNVEFPTKRKQSSSFVSNGDWCTNIHNGYLKLMTHYKYHDYHDMIIDKLCNNTIDDIVNGDIYIKVNLYFDNLTHDLSSFTKIVNTRTAFLYKAYIANKLETNDGSPYQYTKNRETINVGENGELYAMLLLHLNITELANELLITDKDYTSCIAKAFVFIMITLGVINITTGLEISNKYVEIKSNSSDFEAYIRILSFYVLSIIDTYSTFGISDVENMLYCFNTYFNVSKNIALLNLQNIAYLNNSSTNQTIIYNIFNKLTYPVQGFTLATIINSIIRLGLRLNKIHFYDTFLNKYIGIKLFTGDDYNNTKVSLMLTKINDAIMNLKKIIKMISDYSISNPNATISEIYNNKKDSLNEEVKDILSNYKIVKLEYAFYCDARKSSGSEHTIEDNRKFMDLMPPLVEYYIKLIKRIDNVNTELASIDVNKEICDSQQYYSSSQAIFEQPKQQHDDLLERIKGVFTDITRYDTTLKKDIYNQKRFLLNLINNIITNYLDVKTPYGTNTKSSFITINFSCNNDFNKIDTTGSTMNFVKLYYLKSIVDTAISTNSINTKKLFNNINTIIKRQGILDDLEYEDDYYYKHKHANFTIISNICETLKSILTIIETDLTNIHTILTESKSIPSNNIKLISNIQTIKSCICFITDLISDDLNKLSIKRIKHASYKGSNIKYDINDIYIELKKIEPNVTSAFNIINNAKQT